jgi:DNA-binding XRE family transcriptional regulator
MRSLSVGQAVPSDRRRDKRKPCDGRAPSRMISPILSTFSSSCPIGRTTWGLGSPERRFMAPVIIRDGATTMQLHICINVTLIVQHARSLQMRCNSISCSPEGLALPTPRRSNVPGRKAASVALRVRRAREARGLSRQELALKAGVALRTVFNLESGERQPRGKTLRKILEALQNTPMLPEV